MIENINSLFPYNRVARQLLATGIDYSKLCNAVKEVKADEDPMLDDDISKRFSIWSTYTEQLKGDTAVPLIIVIGGGSGTGKSTLASEIAYRLGIRNVIGTDMLREVMRLNYSIEDEPTLHENTYNCWKPLSVNYTPELLLDGYYCQSKLVNMAVKAIIIRALNDGESIILEGIHLLPSLLPKELLAKTNVISIVLKLQNPELHKQRLYDRCTSTHVKKSGERYMPVFKQIRLVHDTLIEDADSLNVSVIEQSSLEVSLQRSLDIIYSSINVLIS